MKQQHTKGPWKINEPYKVDIVADYGGNDISIAREVRNEANATLIAAAPELLTALKAMVDCRGQAAAAAHDAAEKKARIAIAKAEGRE